jgi:hypothetical protein
MAPKERFNWWLEPESSIDQCCAQYEASSNPLYAWEAWLGWSTHRRSDPGRSDEPPPAWILGYFDDCARRLIERGCRNELPAESRLSSGAIGQALGFASGLSKAREQWSTGFRDHEELASKIVDLMWRESWSLNKAAEELQRKGGSTSTAKRAVKTAEGTARLWMELNRRLIR